MDNKTTNTPAISTPSKEPSKTLIYVSNLSFDTTDEQFKDLFKGFNVKTAYVARRKNGRSKGFGFANLEKESDQKAAIEKLNGFEFEKRKLVAKVAMNDDRRNEKGELREEFKTQTTNNSPPSETVVYVSNLEWSVNDEELRKIFAEFNPKVASVAKRRNGSSKGFGFVEFNNKEDQQKALKLDNQKIGGREIIVKPSTGYRGDKPEGNNNTGGKNITTVKRRTDFTLYVKNLPMELDENDLRDVFQEFHPKSARIVSRGGKSSGYGFVEFNNNKDQNDAQVALDQSEINGRVVTVSISTSRKDGRNNNRNNNRRNDNNRGGNNNRGRNNNNNNNNRGGNNNNNRRNNNNNNNNNRRNDNNRGGNNNNNNNNRSERKPRENREVSTNLVYVSNLPFNLEDKGLEEIFKGLKINKAYVARRRNGYSKGFGFVEFSSSEDQQKAIKQNGNEISGRPIVVQAAFKVDEKTN